MAWSVARSIMSVPMKLIVLALLAVLLSVGSWLGEWTVREFGYGGLGVFIGSVLAGISGAMLLTLVAIALVLRSRPGGTRDTAARTAFVAAGVLLAGLGIGGVRAVAVPLHQPIVYHAPGTLSVALIGLSGFAGESDAIAQCESGVDSEAVIWLGATAGTIRTDSVTVALSLDPSDPLARPVVRVSVVIAPPAKGAGAVPTGWSGEPAVWLGEAERAEGAADGSSGRTQFSGLLLGVSEAGVPGPTLAGGQPAGWPMELSGSLDWTCGEWIR